MATNFVYDLSQTLNADKTDLSPIPVGANPTQYVQASDWNPVAQAAMDIRSALWGARFYGFEIGAADPSTDGPVPENYLWLRNTNELVLHLAAGNFTFLTGARQVLTAADSGLQGGGALSGDLSLLIRDIFDGSWGPLWTGDSQGPFGSFYINRRGQVVSATALSDLFNEPDVNGSARQIVYDSSGVFPLTITWYSTQDPLLQVDDTYVIWKQTITYDDSGVFPVTIVTEASWSSGIAMATRTETINYDSSGAFEISRTVVVS